jgi:hypothetical protein
MVFGFPSELNFRRLLLPVEMCVWCVCVFFFPPVIESVYDLYLRVGKTQVHSFVLMRKGVTIL